MKLYNFIIAILKYPVKLLFRVKVEGKENEPDTPYIVYGNHSSYVDPVLVTVALKANPVWMGKRELMKYAFLRWIFKVTGSIPINREGLDTNALRKCLATVKEGNCLGIFPQGTRLRRIKPTPQQAHAGLAFIAAMAKATVLPVSIVTKRNQPGMFRKTKIIIHKPIHYKEYSSISNSPSKEEITEYLFSKVCEPFDSN